MGDVATKAAVLSSTLRSVRSTIRAIVRSVIGVRTYVGQTAFAVTPVPATSAAMERISPTAACVDAVYAAV